MPLPSIPSRSSLLWNSERDLNSVSHAACDIADGGLGTVAGGVDGSAGHLSTQPHRHERLRFGSPLPEPS
jgi:hypothetical protein